MSRQSGGGPGAGRPTRRPVGATPASRPVGAAPASRRDSGSGPAATAAGHGSGSAKRTRAPQPRRFTGRAMILGVVMLGLLLAYAYPVRVFLAQQAEIAALEERQERQRTRITELEERYAKWNDEQYAISQARKRLHMTLPGETPYFVIDPEASQAANAAAPNPEPKREIPWYGKLWSSIESADQR